MLVRVACTSDKEAGYLSTSLDSKSSFLFVVASQHYHGVLEFSVYDLSLTIWQDLLIHRFSVFLTLSKVPATYSVSVFGGCWWQRPGRGYLGGLSPGLLCSERQGSPLGDS